MKKNPENEKMNKMSDEKKEKMKARMEERRK